jgi:hypothetical protein
LGFIFQHVVKKLRFPRLRYVSDGIVDRCQVSAIIKFQIVNHKHQMVGQAVRQTHGPEQGRRTHYPEPVEGQITRT